jgi:hypothetical protein
MELLLGEASGRACYLQNVEEDDELRRGASWSGTVSGWLSTES